MNLERITSDDQLLAITLTGEAGKLGIQFFTGDTESQQIAYMRRPTGTEIQPHLHRPVTFSLESTQEILFIRQGQLKVNFYTSEQQYVTSRVLYSGDVIVLVAGGHGFEVLEEVEAIEVKQGPYLGEAGKIRFSDLQTPLANVVASGISNGK
jgi:mannose-6-phosphate isomerase-like protein (cupin superfamily)